MSIVLRTVVSFSAELRSTHGQKRGEFDWTIKESVRAKIRVMVKRILRKYGYPPDKQERATQTVLEQAEVLCADWAA
ncbi:MAG TPA: type I restriction enzyme endonuclease domain-containing protein [Bryobacteraceae bacterium]|nr:type I restriction enzyme endonuclease domain-containing protein [Bryobacteraceae bacterium]